MKKEPANELKNSINKLSEKIGQLKSRIVSCEKSNRDYNRLLIERASIRKRLKELQSTNIVSFWYKRIEQKNGQKRICDYFNS